MNEVFEQGAQQKLVLYTEGNEIIAVRLPLRTGGEYVLRDGYLADLTAVVLENTIRFAWAFIGASDYTVGYSWKTGSGGVKRRYECEPVWRTAACEPGRKTLAVLYSEGTCRISLERVSVPTRGGRGCPGTSGSL